MLVWVITTAKVDKVDRKALRAPTGPNGNRRPRRSFRPEYKLAVLAEYDRCNDHGQRDTCSGEKACTHRWSRTGAGSTGRVL